MMGVIVESGVGGPAEGERWQVWRPAALKPGGPLLVVCHGAASHGHYYGAHPARQRMFLRAARSGIVVAAGDLGNADPDAGPLDGTWGTPISVTRASEDMVTWAGDRWGVDTTRVLVIGDSAGGATALNALRARPDRIVGCALRLAVANVTAAYEMGNPLVTELIDAAHGGDWSAVADERDPARNLEDFAGLGHRVRIYYSADDGLIPAETLTAFAEAIGATAGPIGAVGHDAEVAYPAFPDGDFVAWAWARWRAAD